MSEAQWNLHKDLIKYGLNPAEWTIRELTEQRFKIAHVKDHAFCFLGETQKNGLFLQWTKLQLLSF